MKQLRNIVAGMLVLIGGMLPATTFAQEPVPGDTTATLQQEIIVGKDTINQEANRGRCKRHCVRPYWRFLRVAYHEYRKNFDLHSVADYRV